MAILKNGILGGISGKVSGVVGSNWRGLDTIRGYSKPSNPNTVAQQTQRSKFSFAVAFAKNILTSIIQPYWAGKNAHMSAFNSFMKTNIALTDDTDGVNLLNKISTGSLETTSIVANEYAGVGVTITWDGTCIGNGLSTDSVLAVIYDRENDIAFVSDAGDQRGDEEVSLTVGSGRTATDLYCFLAFYRGSDETLITSNSTSKVATAP